MRLMVCAIIGLSLVGCATAPVNLQPARYEAAIDCLGSIEQVPAATLAVVYDDTRQRDQPTLKPINEIGACVRDGDLARPVLLYSLRALAVPAELNIAVAAGSAGRDSASTALAPLVMLLDAQRQPVKRFDLAAFERRGSVYTLTTFVNDPAQLGGYLLIEPDQSRVGQKTQSIQGESNTIVVPIGYSFVAINTGGEVTRTAYFSDVGSVSAFVRIRAPMPTQPAE